MEWTADTVRRKQKELLFPNVGTYYEQALPLESGRGMFLKDVEGREYLDFFAGILTVSVGHCHPRVTESAISQQKKLVHVSTLYPTVPQLELAERLVQLRPMKEKAKVFFTNSGTEANETAVVLAKEATGREELVVLRHNYAGRGTLALSMMGHKNYRPRTQSDVPGIRFAHAPYCYRCDFGLQYPDCGVACAKDLKSLIETTTDGEIAAFMAEPILGVGGFITPPQEYFQIAVPIARNAGGLFISDEVQTAWGRTGGKWWGAEQYGVEPDILTSAKGMANGQPIGLTMARAAVADKGTFANISTFGGSPISMAAASATLQVIEEEKLLFNAQMMGKALRQGLESLKERFQGVGDVRGMGLMQAIELVKDRGSKEPDPQATNRLMEATRKRGLLIGKGGLYGNALRIAPPLIVNQGQIDDALRILGEGLQEALRQ
ncbi:MAG TPA: aspartate aminotransferase family protein [Myxococcales bacterium]|nr:aspartate aminotransferase family protein [Myxococcales bacterium]